MDDIGSGFDAGVGGNMDAESFGFGGPPPAPPLFGEEVPVAPPFGPPEAPPLERQPSSKGMKRKAAEVELGEHRQKVQRAGEAPTTIEGAKIRGAGTGKASQASLGPEKVRKLKRGEPIKVKRPIPANISDFIKAESALANATQHKPGQIILGTTFLTRGLKASKLAEKGIQQLINAISKEPDATNRAALVKRLFEYQVGLLTLQSSMRQMLEAPSQKLQKGYAQLVSEARAEVQKMTEARPQLAVHFFAANHKWLRTASDALLASMAGKGGGVSGAVKQIDDAGEALAIAKPPVEESMGSIAFEDRALHTMGGQTAREVAGSAISDFVGVGVVPPTVYAHFKSQTFAGMGLEEEQVVSTQTFAKGAKEIAHLGRDQDPFLERILTSDELRDTEFVRSLDDKTRYPFDVRGEIREYTGAQIKEMVAMGQASFLDKVKTIPLEQAQSHMMHSILTGALDEENENNTMMMMQPMYDPAKRSFVERPIAIKIDNGLSLPTLRAKDWCPKFCWYDWPQSREPLCAAVAQQIDKSNVFRNIERLEAMFREAAREAGTQGKDIKLDEGAYYFLIASDMACKLGAKFKLSPYEIAETMKTFITHGVILRQKVEKEGAGAPLPEKLERFQKESQAKLIELMQARMKRKG